MALEIRSTPVLTGEDAERFVREAEENERNPQRRKLLFSFEDIDRMVKPCLSEKRRTRDKINLSYRYKVELNMKEKVICCLI